MIKKLLDWLRGRWKTSKTKPFMVCVPEEAEFEPGKFLDTVAQGYHIRLAPPTLSYTAQAQYLQEMINKIRHDKQLLVATNISRWDNSVRDFVSVRRMREGDIADILPPWKDIDVGEL